MRFGDTEPEDIKSIVIDDKEVRVAPSMVWLGSYRCVVCEEPVDWAVFVDGVLYFDCEYEHRSEIEIG